MSRDPRRALPDDWPAMYIELRCQACGEDIACELIRPAVFEKWDRLSSFWRELLERHIAEHRGKGNA